MTIKKEGAMSFDRLRQLGLGITGGIAASGTATAEEMPGGGGGGNGGSGPSDHGEISLKSFSNNWEYELITPSTDTHELKKGDKGQDVDLEGWNNHLAYGQVSEADWDNLWLHSDSAVTGIDVTVLNDSDSLMGWVEIEIRQGPDTPGIYVTRDSNPDQEYDYTFEFDQGDLGSAGTQNSPDLINKDITGGTVRGTLSSDERQESFWRTAKHPDLIQIEDVSGGILSITLPN